VWSSETHRPTTAVRTEFDGLISDASPGAYGEQIAKAIKHASGGHRGEVVA
jgi:hypothetical protein